MEGKTYETNKTSIFLEVSVIFNNLVYQLQHSTYYLKTPEKIHKHKSVGIHIKLMTTDEAGQQKILLDYKINILEI